VKTAQPQKGKITIERKLKATLGEVWDRWTTSSGIESWWGPDGFLTKVTRLDIRPGGCFEYAMKAIEEAQIYLLESAGRPPTSVGRGAYTVVRPGVRLGYTTLVDFIPGVAPYEVSTTVDFKKVPEGVVIVVVQDEMHDPEWTQMTAIGLDEQVNRLARALSGPAQE